MLVKTYANCHYKPDVYFELYTLLSIDLHLWYHRTNAMPAQLYLLV